MGNRRRGVASLLFILALVLSFGAPCPAEARVFPAPYRLSVDTGFNFLNYHEGKEFQPSLGVTSFEQLAVTVDAELLYYIVSTLNDDTARYEGQLAFLGDVSFTALPITSSVAGTTVRVLRANLRLGVPINIVPLPFSVNLMGGYYTTTMWVTDSAFGYTNLAGPQIYPVLHYSHFNDKFVQYVFSAFYKYSPVTDGLSPFSWSSREVSGGVAARFALDGEFEFLKQGYERALTFKASYANLQHTFTVVRNTTVRSDSYTITVGYDW